MTVIPATTKKRPYCCSRRKLPPRVSRFVPRNRPEVVMTRNSRVERWPRPMT